MTRSKKRLGELLLEAGLIDEFQLKSALAYQREWGGRLGSALIRKGFIKEKEMMSVIEKQYGMRCVPLDEFERPADEVLKMFSDDKARKFGMLPQKFNGKTLVVLTSDPTDLQALDDLGFLLGVRLKPLLALESDINTALDHFYNPDISSGELKRREFCSPGELASAYKAPDSPNSEDKASSTFDDKHAVISGIVDLLVEKGIFTRDELSERINLRKG